MTLTDHAETFERMARDHSIKFVTPDSSILCIDDWLLSVAADLRARVAEGDRRFGQPHYGHHEGAEPAPEQPDAIIGCALEQAADKCKRIREKHDGFAAQGDDGAHAWGGGANECYRAICSLNEPALKAWGAAKADKERLEDALYKISEDRKQNRKGRTESRWSRRNASDQTFLSQQLRGRGARHGFHR